MQEQDASVSAYPCLQGFWNMSYMASRRVGIQELNASPERFAQTRQTAAGALHITRVTEPSASLIGLVGAMSKMGCLWRFGGARRLGG